MIVNWDKFIKLKGKITFMTLASFIKASWLSVKIMFDNLDWHCITLIEQFFYC